MFGFGPSGSPWRADYHDIGCLDRHRGLAGSYGRRPRNRNQANSSPAARNLEGAVRFEAPPSGWLLLSGMGASGGGSSEDADPPVRHAPPSGSAAPLRKRSARGGLWAGPDRPGRFDIGAPGGLLSPGRIAPSAPTLRPRHRHSRRANGHSRQRLREAPLRPRRPRPGCAVGRPRTRPESIARWPGNCHTPPIVGGPNATGAASRAPSVRAEAPKPCFSGSAEVRSDARAPHLLHSGSDRFYEPSPVLASPGISATAGDFQHHPPPHHRPVHLDGDPPAPPPARSGRGLSQAFFLRFRTARFIAPANPGGRSDRQRAWPRTRP
jgi:hypothetical protein